MVPPFFDDLIRELPQRQLFIRSLIPVRQARNHRRKENEMPIISQNGLSVDVPAGWQRRAFESSALKQAVLQVANFALPEDDNDLGTNAQESMPAAGVYVNVFEYAPDPDLDAEEFIPAPATVQIKTA